MATVTTPRPPFNRYDSQRRVTHPLERLRGYIRFYVSAEGLAVLLLYVSLWFWIGLALDYGSFKLLHFDWVQELPHGLRVVVLCGLVAGLLAVVTIKVLLRLLREFRHAALALVLERRFPSLLGDRLITAVEMADPRMAAHYGYSQAMINQTIHDAAERVDPLPVAEVFNWKRLRRYSAAVVLVTVGLFLLTGASYAVSKLVQDEPVSVSAFVSDLQDVAGIWFERNILLIDTIWPRRAHLELVDFPGDELKIGRDSPPPTLRVRAWKWVIADKDRTKAPEGWRPLAWADLTPRLLGSHSPQPPADWKPKVPDRGLTVDEVELQLDKPEVMNLVDANLVLALRATFRQLDNLVAEPRMKRRLRKLIVPTEVKVILTGETMRSEQGLQRQADNEYAGTISELKESVRFTVRGEDYDTPAKRITVVPPPDLVELTIDEDQPAYLYHLIPRGGTAADLRGRKQQFRGRPISLTGEKSMIEVPAGTDVTLTAKTSKDLCMPNGVRIITGSDAGISAPIHGDHDRAGSVPAGRSPVNTSTLAVEQPDSQTFRTRFRNVTVPIDLLFDFTDTDNVSNQRHVIIKPVLDMPPDVDVQLEVLRKTNQGYLCTATARIPFSGKVHDDHGLADIDYVFTVARVESEIKMNDRLARAANLAAYGPGGLIQKLVALALVHAAFKSATSEDQLREQKLRLDNFDRLLKERALEAMTPQKLLEMLQAPAPGTPEAARRFREAYLDTPAVNHRLLNDFRLDPDIEGLGDRADFFDVSRLGLKVSGQSAFQPHYRLRLTVTATDNNVETGPLTSQNKEKFTLLIVSEDELLVEIGKEEENLHFKLQETVDHLKDARTKLDKVVEELPGLKPEEFSPMTRRTEEISETISKGSDVAREVLTDYRRILKELKVNQDRQDPSSLVTKMIAKVNDKVVEPLDAALNLDFIHAGESMDGFHKSLEDKNKDTAPAQKAREDLAQLISRLSGVLDAMAEVTTISKLIEKLVRIKNGEEDAEQNLQELRDIKTKEILKQIEQTSK